MRFTDSLKMQDVLDALRALYSASIPATKRREHDKFLGQWQNSVNQTFN
jgi:hypothetical protein